MAGREAPLDGLGSASIPAAFGSLLAIASDAVVAFERNGRIILANEQADRLFRAGEGGLYGRDIRDIFCHDDVESGRPPMPFLLEGSSLYEMCLPDGMRQVLSLRCERVSSQEEIYILAAHEADRAAERTREAERELKDLQRTNKRLSGTLKIVMDTLDNTDVDQLFSRTLEEIAETMEATGTMVYLAEQEGFRLRGFTSALENSYKPLFLTFRQGVPSALLTSEKALRFRVLPLTPEALRAGECKERVILDEDTQATKRLPASILPPFESFIAVPVWFGGHVIAIIAVGWERRHPTSRDDGRLLEMVASYLSVQLMGAFTQMRTEHAARLESLRSDLKERLFSTGQPVGEAALSFFESVSEGIGCIFCPVEFGEHGTPMVAVMPDGRYEMPEEICALLEERSGTEASLVPILPGSDLSEWLLALGECSIGVYVEGGRISGRRAAYMALRPHDAEPLDTEERSFLRRCTDDFAEIMHGSVRRLQDQRISQALQLGMKNVLQEVEGLTARGIYSSATADAFVGGDFYDLIRLPQRRAAIIMGDVSGKGIEAASVSAAVKTALAAYAWEDLPPARMVRSLNDFLLGFSRIETFATLFIGVIDLSTGTLEYCSAGHPPAILYKASDGEFQMLDVQSGIVGAFEDMTYVDGEVEVSPGDFLLLYTDGTTEARSPSGSFFGEDGLKDALAHEAAGGFDGILDRLLATLDAYTDRNLDDDVAMVAIRFDRIGA